jgi:hypothetical protein
MHSLRVIAPLGVAAAVVGLVAVSSAEPSSGPDRTPDTYRGPVATSSGGGGGGSLVYPSIVGTRLDRAGDALSRATTRVDQGHAALAVTDVKAAQANMQAAWTATRYVIRTTPPPPVATDGSFAHSSGGAPGGPAFASPQDTAMAVFSLEDEVVTVSAAILGANAALDTTLSTAIGSAVRTRDAAVAYIHKVAPPPPVASDGRVHAGASGGAIAASWDSTMPNALILLSDEIQALRGTRATSKTLSASSSAFLKSVIAQDGKTKAAINQFWPPIVADD